MSTRTVHGVTIAVNSGFVVVTKPGGLPRYVVADKVVVIEIGEGRVIVSHVAGANIEIKPQMREGFDEEGRRIVEETERRLEEADSAMRLGAISPREFRRMAERITGETGGYDLEAEAEVAVIAVADALMNAIIEARTFRRG